MNRVQIISDKNQRSLKIKSIIQKKINQNNLQSALRIKILRENIESIKIIKPIDIYDL